jgi:bisphosphoglycerate-dependent phosphoglycerate mutase
VAQYLVLCHDRYFRDRIVPESINQGKRVLISSSENAIRGLLMYLCDIPESEITDLEIPNGLPIIFDCEKKCIKVRYPLFNLGHHVDADAKPLHHIMRLY